MAYCSMPSVFPVENRPIFVSPVVKATGGKDKMGEWGPKIVKAVDKIVSHYSENKGIIHTHNFAISKMLMDQCENQGRFLYQENFKNKEDMLQMHARLTNSVIVAPAMHEGLDLHGDLSRFQIICKVPYPNFFEDMQLARRVELDRRYLIWLTLLKLVQSVGRSVRSPTDWAHTFIIDAQVIQFLKESKRMQPVWFSQAIQICD
jgi:ATP-dependent DNA helicase DinG